MVRATRGRPPAVQSHEKVNTYITTSILDNCQLSNIFGHTIERQADSHALIGRTHTAGIVRRERRLLQPDLFV